MSDLVTLTIDGVEVSVPRGTVIADAAKRVDIDIPVFCHHPKLEPVGMCRMCLVEVGMPMRDRATGELLLEEDGSPKMNWGRGMQTGCTVQVAPGMQVRTTTKGVDKAREDVIEFLLTSHPLDCPICDKGGECPLQNLTMEHGKGETRFLFDEKMKLDKHVPLGDLIYLDRERCIQCARCIRFQDEVVDDPVIAFHNRGRRLEIATLSDPGFDSHWSGNTTDICPVGALTTADFRFGARPWELTPVASICPHCPVGCNTTMSTRREAKAGGQAVIKRVMPRQNEKVNEIWICDKGRFVHHFADHPDRLRTPMIRRNGQLEEATWDETIEFVATKLQNYGVAAAGLAGEHLSNEDYFAFRQLFAEGLKSHHYDIAGKTLAGGDVVAQVGIASGSDLQQLGKGDAILVVASDLHEEAPVWWMRVKQASERGATLVVLNGRATRLDVHADLVIHYSMDEALTTVRQLVGNAKVTDAPEGDEILARAGQALVNANNLVIFYGYEGLSYAETDSLAKMLGNLLLLKPHAGKVNNGLIPVWSGNNTQGAWDTGVASADKPDIYGDIAQSKIQALYVVGADPIGDGHLKDKQGINFLVVQDLFMTKTAEVADVILPAQSWAEREGTFTSGERRVQRYYQAISPVGQSRPDWQILLQIGEKLQLGKPKLVASLVFKEMTKHVPAYAGMSYRSLAHVEEQFPKVGGDDLYYGGTSYNNQAGLGQQGAVGAESGSVESFTVSDKSEKRDGLQIVQVKTLYQPSTWVDKSDVLATRVSQATVFVNPVDAQSLNVTDGKEIDVHLNGTTVSAKVHVNEDVNAGMVAVRGTRHYAGEIKIGMMEKVN